MSAVVRAQTLSVLDVGGASGMRINVTAFSKLENYPQDFVSLYSRIGSSADSKDRFIMVDVEGRTVVIDVGTASAGEFDEFLPKAQKVLDTVEWKSE